MSAAAPRVLSYSDLPGFLDSLEDQISEADAFQWSELGHGNLAIWIQSAGSRVDHYIIRQDLAEEFRTHEGIRCAIIDVMSSKPSKNLSGLEKASIIVQLESASRAR